jgi:hypothetical protein
MNDSRQLVVSAEALSRAISAMQLSLLRGDDGCQLVASYELDTPEGIERRERHECDARDNGKSWINRTMKVVAFTLSRTVLPDASGDMRDLPLLTLEMDTGDLCNIFSAPALRCFGSRLRSHLLGGPLDDKHPLSLILVQRKTNGPNSMYWFERP